MKNRCNIFQWSGPGVLQRSLFYFSMHGVRVQYFSALREGNAHIHDAWGCNISAREGNNTRTPTPGPVHHHHHHSSSDIPVRHGARCWFSQCFVVMYLVWCSTHYRIIICYYIIITYCLSSWPHYAAQLQLYAAQANGRQAGHRRRLRLHVPFPLLRVASLTKSIAEHCSTTRALNTSPAHTASLSLTQYFRGWRRRYA